MRTTTTPRSALAEGIHPSATCLECKRCWELDLPRLIERGYGDRPLSLVPLICRCGSRWNALSFPGDDVVPPKA